MCCTVVFGIKLKLLVINISSSSPAINTIDYYQRCVITCVVHQRPHLQHLACCWVNTSSQAIYRLRIAISAHSTCIRRPITGFPSEYCYAVWHRKLEWRGYPMVKKFWSYVYSFWHNLRMWQMDRQTDTTWRHRPCLLSIAQQKWQGLTVSSAVLVVGRLLVACGQLQLDALATQYQHHWEAACLHKHNVSVRGGMALCKVVQHIHHYYLHQRRLCN